MPNSATKALIMALTPLNQRMQETVWFIGDSRSDLELAKAARCTGVLVHPDHAAEAERHADCAPRISTGSLEGLAEIIFATP